MFALKYRNTEKFVALDSASGGYPYAVSSLNRAKLWANKDDAEEYNAVSSWRDYNHPVFELIEVNFDYKFVEARTGEDLEALLKRH